MVAAVEVEQIETRGSFWFKMNEDILSLEVAMEEVFLMESANQAGKVFGYVADLVGSQLGCVLADKKREGFAGQEALGDDAGSDA